MYAFLDRKLLAQPRALVARRTLNGSALRAARGTASSTSGMGSAISLIDW
jgi:hypothetical protein